LSSWAAVTAALGASTCAAAANALQHRTAVSVADRVPVGVGAPGAAASVRATVTHRLWLLAVVLQGMGFLLHALALRFGQLTVVQPLLVCAVLFALPMNRVLRRERITVHEMAWAGLLVVGLAGFLVAESSPAAPAAPRVDVTPAVWSTILGIGAVVACVVVSHTRPRFGAAALGTAAGILFAGQAALLKSSVGLAGGGVVPLLTHWQPYALLVVGTAGVVFTQLAFRAGPLSASLPLIATVNPVLGVLVGAGVYDETVRTSGPALVIEVAGLLLLTAATALLTRMEHLRA
jgi:uncharacterized membrane protein